MTGLALVALAACGSADPSIGLAGDGSENAVDHTDDPVVATVEGTQLYLSEVRRAAAARGVIAEDAELPPTDPAFAETVDELI
ncbi:MAG: hypothetical protein WBF53_01510, partial [Litorimonas sp.]